MRITAARAGASIEVIPCDAKAAVDPQALNAMIDERVRLVAPTWLPAHSGLVNPAAAIGQVARCDGASYFIDAAQAVSQSPVDVVDLGCDVLTCAGRKALRGRRCTGLLCVLRDFLARLTRTYVDMHSAAPDVQGEPAVLDDAARFESAEFALAPHCGFANALDEALSIGIADISARIDFLARELRVQLAGIRGVNVPESGVVHSGLVAFNAEGVDAAQVQRRLADEGIVIGSNGVAYAPLDMQARGLTSFWRRRSATRWATWQRRRRSARSRALAAMAYLRRSRSSLAVRARCVCCEHGESCAGLRTRHVCDGVIERLLLNLYPLA